jgi:hypothetical protein
MAEAAPPPTPLEVLAPSLHYPPETVAEKTRTIYETIRHASPNLHSGNFTTISGADLARLFDLYDSAFYGGAISAALRQRGSGLSFRVAPRMTRAGGKTFSRRRPPGGGRERTDYEIAVSSTLLFQSFEAPDRVIRINGQVCADRLESLQRVMEHELLHLVELLIWGKSSCAAERFKVLALGTFAHTEVTHDLVTQHERARAKFGLRVGDLVTFEFEGVRRTGRLNRITRRATVLVEAPKGAPYSDGKRYMKFYVPLTMLEKAGGMAPGTSAQ